MQFFNRVVGFDLDVAKRYGSLMARAKKNGHNPNAMDVLIAATAAANGMALATLNRKDFEKLGVELVEF
jgi:predicted nucleic acid-binding protein